MYHKELLDYFDLDQAGSKKSEELQNRYSDALRTIDNAPAKLEIKERDWNTLPVKANVSDLERLI